MTAPDKKGSRDATSEVYVEEFLYNLEADPYELNNLIGLGSHRELADALRERLIKRMQLAWRTASTHRKGSAKTRKAKKGNT